MEDQRALILNLLNSKNIEEILNLCNVRIRSYCSTGSGISPFDVVIVLSTNDFDNIEDIISSFLSHNTSLIFHSGFLQLAPDVIYDKYLSLVVAKHHELQFINAAAVTYRLVLMDGRFYLLQRIMTSLQVIIAHLRLNELSEAAIFYTDNYIDTDFLAYIISLMINKEIILDANENMFNILAKKVFSVQTNDVLRRFFLDRINKNHHNELLTIQQLKKPDNYISLFDDNV